jgi:hypothetical protein
MKILISEYHKKINTAIFSNNFSLKAQLSSIHPNFHPNLVAFGGAGSLNNSAVNKTRM